MNSVSPKIHVEVLTPHVTVFGDRAFKDVVRLNETMRVEPQSAGTGVLTKEEETQSTPLSPCETQTEGGRLRARSSSHQNAVALAP